VKDVPDHPDPRTRATTTMLASAVLVVLAAAIGAPFVPAGARVALLLVVIAAIGVTARMLSRLFRRR
jgi:hypothetical protein